MNASILSQSTRTNQKGRSSFKAPLAILLATVTVLFSATIATAATRYWVAGNGNWSTSGNWSLADVPGADDDANIGPFGDGVARTITYDYTGVPVTLNSLKLDLTGPGVEATTLNMAANNLTSTYEYVGNDGRGTFEHSGGTNTIAAGAGYLDVGVYSGSMGTYNLSGTGALEANTSEYIGDIGTGVFNQTGGSNTINGGAALYLGYNASGTSGTYSLSSGTLTIDVGREFIGFGVAGFFIQTGGTNTPQGGVSLGTNAGADGTYTLSGGSLSSDGGEIIGEFGTGTFNQDGGDNSIHSGTDLIVGFKVDSVGTYNLSGSGTVSTSSDLDLGIYGSGTFNQSGGTVLVQENLNLAAIAGSSGTYTLTAGDLIANTSNTNTYTTSIGGNGMGAFTQSGGTSNFGASGVAITKTGGDSGAFLLSGGSAVTTDMSVGGVNGTGTADLTVSGSGELSVDGVLSVVNSPGYVVNLNGGTINTAALNFNGNPANFHWTGGTLNFTQDVTWDSAAADTSTSAAFGSSLAVGSGQTLMVTGNETLDGAGPFALTLNSGSTHTVTGGITLGPAGSLTQNTGSTLSYSTFTQAGGTVNGSLQNQTTFIYQSGLFNGRLLNHGTISFSSSFVAGNGIENDVAMTVAAGQTLTTNGAGLDNHDLFTIESGGKLVATSVANQSEMIVQGLATATNFSNAGLLHGVGQVEGAVTNTASGEVRIVAGERLRFAGASFTNQGLVDAIGGSASPAELEFNSLVTNTTANGLIVGSNSLFRFNNGLTNQASFALSIGTNNVLGDINNAATGKIVVSGGAGVTFYDDIVQNGIFRVSKVGSTTSVAVVLGSFTGAGGSTGGGDIFFEGDLRPGNSPASVMFDNDVGFGSGAALMIELGGTNVGTQYDQVNVTGQLLLDGTLDVSLINGFNPQAGNSFDILDFNPGSLSGSFAALNFPALTAGLSWNTSQLYTTGVLSVVASLSGDFDFDGDVDGNDFLVWQRGGSPHGVGSGDLALWQAQYGQGAGSRAPTRSVGRTPVTAIPEPGPLSLTFIGLTLFFATPRYGAKLQGTQS